MPNRRAKARRPPAASIAAFKPSSTPTSFPCQDLDFQSIQDKRGLSPSTPAQSTIEHGRPSMAQDSKYELIAQDFLTAHPIGTVITSSTLLKWVADHPDGSAIKADLDIDEPAKRLNT